MSIELNDVPSPDEIEKIFQQIIGEASYSDELIAQMRNTFHDLYNKGIILQKFDLQDSTVKKTSLKATKLTNLTAAIPHAECKLFIAEPSGMMQFQTETNMFIPCSYNNFHNETFNIVSENYQYANTIQGMAICSHPKVAASVPAGELPFCAFMHDHKSCQHYASKLEILADTTVSVANTSRQLHFQLSYAPMINFFENQYAHVFTITNVTDETVVNEIVLPSHEFDFDQAKIDALQVFDEYMNVFANDTVNTTNEPKTLELGAAPATTTPVSYFSHILSLA